MSNLVQSVFCLLGIIFFQLVYAQSLPYKSADATSDYHLVWQDNFDGNTLDETNNWVIEVNGEGGGNSELQYYRRENISIGREPMTGANCLIIKAKRENYSGKTCTSGRLNTLGKMSFRNGKIVARIKLPTTANGLWPAFWMLGADHLNVGWPKCGEIDIMEMGNANGINNGTQDRYLSTWFHWGESWNNGSYPNWGNEYTNATSIQDGFYLFTLIWDDNSLKSYFGTDADPLKVNIVEMAISGDAVAETTGNYFHKPFYVIFNLAIGGNFTQIWDINNITALNAANNYEAKMYVDYVRVYQLGGSNEVYNGPALDTSVKNGIAIKNKFDVYPNPTIDNISIKGEDVPKCIAVYSISGKQILRAFDTTNISMSNFPSGEYLLQITDVNNKIELHNVIKK